MTRRPTRLALAALVCLGSLAACGDDDDAATSGGATDTTSAPATTVAETTTSVAEETTTVAEADDAAESATIGAVATEAGATFVPGYTPFAAGYAEAVEGEGPVTALMPLDSAFIAFGTSYPNLMEELRADFDLLDQVLLYHALDGAIDSEALAAGEITTLQGETITVEVVDGSIVLNGGQATVTEADLEASNGIVHILDGILLPPSIAATAS